MTSVMVGEVETSAIDEIVTPVMIDDVMEEEVVTSNHDSNDVSQRGKVMSIIATVTAGKFDYSTSDKITTTKRIQ